MSERYYEVGWGDNLVTCDANSGAEEIDPLTRLNEQDTEIKRLKAELLEYRELVRFHRGEEIQPPEGE